MYLSKVSFLTTHVKESARFLRGGLFEEHQLIWNLFENSPQQTRDFLYRREDKPKCLPYFYVLSQRKPETQLEQLDIQTKPFNPVIKRGDRLAFSLRANAVVTRKIGESSNKRIRRDIIEAKVDEYKKRFENPADLPGSTLIHHEAATEWINRQSEQHGFNCHSFHVENHQYRKAEKPGDKNIRVFTSLDFYGDIEVQDTDRFIEILSSGLGRSKAFGCGLMLIRRV